MNQVTVSSKFQVVIPRPVREAAGIGAGDQLQVFLYGDRIELIPLRSMRELRGFLKGVDLSEPKDKERT